jgi:hypothetical protein
MAARPAALAVDRGLRLRHVARVGEVAVVMFDRIAAALVTAWFMAGLWLVIQSLLRPARLAPKRDGDAE